MLILKKEIIIQEIINGTSNSLSHIIIKVPEMAKCVKIDQECTNLCSKKIHLFFAQLDL